MTDKTQPTFAEFHSNYSPAGKLSLSILEDYYNAGMEAGKAVSGQDTQLTPEQAEAIQITVANWDSTTAVQRAVEELQELSLALLHWSRDRVPYSHVKSEMADVHIVLRHLEFRFGEYQAFLADKIKKGCLPPPSEQQETGESE